MAVLDTLSVLLEFNSKGVKRGLDTLDRGISQARRRMGGLTGGIDRVNARMQAARPRLDSFAGSAFAIGASLSAAVFQVGRTINTFEEGVNELNAVLLNETPENLSRLEQQAKQLGATTSKSATDAVNAQTELARAGLSAQQVLAAAPHTLNLAIAGNLSMADSAQMVGAALKSYRFDAEESGRVTDVFAATASNSAFTVGEIGSALRQVAPIARSFNVPFEQTLAALGTLRSSGLQPEQAGTALRNIMAILTEKPSGRVQEGFAKLGLTWEEVNAQFLKSGDIVGVMRTLQSAGLDGSDALNIFGREGGAAAINLAVMGGAAAELQVKLQAAAGTAEEMSEAQEKGLPGAVKKFKSALEALQLTLGEGGLKGLMERVLRTITRWILILNDASPAVQKLIIGALLAGPVLLGLAAAAKGVSTALGVVGSVLRGLKLLLLANPLALFLVAIAAGAAFVISNWDRIKLRLGRSIGVLKQSFGPLAATFKRLVTAIGGVFTGLDAGADAGDVMRAAIEKLSRFVWQISLTFDRWAKAIENLSPEQREMIGTLLSLIPVILGAVAAFKIVMGIVRAFQVVWALLNAVLVASPIGLIILAVVALAAAAFLIYKNWDKIAAWFETLWANVKQIFSNAWNGIVGFLKTVWEGIKAGFGIIKKVVMLHPLILLPRLIIENWQDIVGFFENIFGGIAKAAQAVGGFFGRMFGKGDADVDLSDAGRSAVGTFAQGMAEAGGVIPDALRDQLGPMGDYLPASDARRGPLSRLTDAGASLMGTIAKGMASGSGALGGALQRALPSMAKIMNVFRDLLSGVGDATGGFSRRTVSFIGRTVDSVRGFVGSIGGLIRGGLRLLGSAGRSLIGSLIQGVTESVGSVIEQVRRLGRRVVEMFRGEANLGDVARELLATVVTIFSVTPIGRLFGWLMDGWDKAIAWIRETDLSGVWDWLTERIAPFRWLEDAWTATAEWLRSFDLSGVWSWLTERVAPFRWLETAWQSLVDWLRSFNLGGILGSLFGIQDGEQDGERADPFQWLRDAWTGILEWLGSLSLWDAGAALIGTLVDGVRSTAQGIGEAVKNALGWVGNLLPGSDAQEGPLSRLTAAGRAIMTTLAAGVQAAGPTLLASVKAALAGPMGATTAGQSPTAGGLGAPFSLDNLASPLPTAPGLPPSLAGQGAAGATNLSLSIGSITISVDAAGKDASEIVRQIGSDVEEALRQSARRLAESADSPILL